MLHSSRSRGGGRGRGASRLACGAPRRRGGVGDDAPDPVVPVNDGAVQHLVHDGVILDVVGLRAWELDAEGIKRVRERHPRLGFNRYGVGLLRENARAVPGCRAAALFATGFGLALKLGPWQD